MRRLAILLICVLMVFTACSKKKDGYYTREMYCMNTVINISVDGNTKNAESICNDAVYFLYEFESEFSITSPKSVVNKFNATSEPFKAEGEFLDLMKLALEVAKNTDGAYDPTVLPLTKLWNITDGGYLPTSEEVGMALSNVNYAALSLEGDTVNKSTAVCIDLGGIAKGYALGKLVSMLSENVAYGMVSVGGNIGVFGEKPDGSLWEIGIKNPFDTETIAGKLRVKDGYVSVSGDYERYFERSGKKYHHIFDTHTGYPADNGMRSVAVYTDNAALGDALSTALFVMGYDKSIEFYNSGIYEFEALFITDDEILMTEGMKEIFTYEN